MTGATHRDKAEPVGLEVAAARPRDLCYRASGNQMSIVEDREPACPAR